MALQTLLNNVSANTVGAALDCSNSKAATFLISSSTGVFDADVKFQASLDGTAWFPYMGKLNGCLESTETRASGYAIFLVEPVVFIRPVITNYKSGYITVIGYTMSREGTDIGMTSAPVVGKKTVTTTASEIYAGASKLSGRYEMAITNVGSGIVYWGPVGVTVATGMPILPNNTVILDFDRNIATPIYCVADANTDVNVVELK